MLAKMMARKTLSITNQLAGAARVSIKHDNLGLR